MRSLPGGIRNANRSGHGRGCHRRGAPMTALAVQARGPVAGMLSRRDNLEYPRGMTVSPTDVALMLRFRDGDAAAFETLYRRHNDGLYRYLLRLCLNRATAEDLYQEAWSRVIKARRRYRPTAAFTTWLYRIAHNCFIDYTRRNKRHLAGASIDDVDLVDSGKPPEQLAEESLLRDRMLVALADLPDEQRDVFLLYEEAGLNLDAIASVTGVNRETAKSRLRYATSKLKAALKEPRADTGP